jgi:hypothetical protein
MGNDQERTLGTAGSEVDTGSEGDERETAADAAPDVAQEAGAVGAAGGPDLAEKPAEEDAEVDAKKKKKKKDLGVGTSRGIETMFRTMYRVHQDLVGIADAKANMMITVNTLIIGVTVPVLAASTYELADGAGKVLLTLSIIVLLIGCVTALVFAVLAAVPRVSKDAITLEKIARNEGNILFFGHFVKLSEADYMQGMRDLMESQDLLYMNMVRDLYVLGRILDKKFRLLRISYTVFMFALVVGVGTFVVVFALDPNAIGR